MSTVVIGSGIAGLVAAHHLVERGEQVTVISDGDLGGMVRTSHRDGFTLEHGPNVLVERGEVKKLLIELGLGDAVRYPVVPKYKQYVWFRGAPTLVPKSAGALLTSSLFSARTKLELPFKMFSNTTLTPRSEDECILTFFSRLIGASSTTALLDPVLKGIYGGDVESLSARSLFPGLWEAGQKKISVVGYLKEKRRVAKKEGQGPPKIFVIDGGMQRLTDALSAALKNKADFQSGKVLDIQKNGLDGYTLGCADGSVLDCKRVVFTSAGESLAAILRNFDPALSAQLEGVRYAPLYVAHLKVSASQKLIEDAFGVLCSSGMPENFLGVMFNSQIFPHVAPEGYNLLTVMLGGAQAAEDWNPDLHTLQREIPVILKSLFKINSASWLDGYFWKKAIPQLTVGHHKVVTAIEAFESRNPTLAIASVDRGGIGVSERVRLAKEAAYRVLK